MLQKSIIPPTPLGDSEVNKTLADMEEVMRYRLRIFENVPVEMARRRIGTVCPIFLGEQFLNRRQRMVECISLFQSCLRLPSAFEVQRSTMAGFLSTSNF